MEKVLILLKHTVQRLILKIYLVPLDPDQQTQSVDARSLSLPVVYEFQYDFWISEIYIYAEEN